jgi:hypothetical protein
MADILKFQNGEQSEQPCPCCDLKLEFFQYILEAESKEELLEIVSDLVEEAMVLGKKEMVLTDLRIKSQILDQLEGFSDCDCEICDNSCELED